MDQIDLNLLRLLESDARLSYSELADRLSMSKTPVWRRVKALEEAGVIRGYATQLDPEVLGLRLRAQIQIILDIDETEAFEQAVLRHPSIVWCDAMTGDADYTMEILARDMADMDRLIREEIARFPGVTRTRTAVITRAIKSGQSLAELAGRRG